MSDKTKIRRLKQVFTSFNEKVFYSKEISSIGTLGTVKLLKGGAARILNAIGRSFAYASTRAYGAFMLSFGLVSLFLQFAEFYFKSEQGDAFSYIIISGAIALLSLPLLMFDRPMCIALQEFSITDYLFFEFLSIKRMHRNAEVKVIKIPGGVFLGFIPAIVSFFLPIQYVILALFFIAVVFVAFTTPEFPMFLMILSLPYISAIPYSSVVLISLSALTFASYALKVVLGKRTYNFSVYDVIILAIMLTVFIGGIVGRGDDSLKNSAIFIAILLMYFPANNLIVNRRLADLAINGVVISSVPVAILSIVEFIVELGPYDKIPVYSTPGVSVFFTKPQALTAFLLVSAVLSAAYAIEKRRMWKKTLYSGIFMLEVAVLGLTLQPFAWLAMLLGIPAYFIITSKKLPLDLLSVFVLAPLLLFTIPASVLDPFYRTLNVSPAFSGMIAGYTEALLLFGESIWFGIGIGDASYVAAAGAGVSVVNTPLAIALELGIFAVILILSLILMLIRQLSYYRRFMTNSPFTTIKDMSALALTLIMIYGMGADPFSDGAILCLFFIVFGISSSVMRSARNDYNDRFSYYGDSRSSESSVIDIDIR